MFPWPRSPLAGHWGLWQNGVCGFIVGFPWTRYCSPKQITSGRMHEGPAFFQAPLPSPRLTGVVPRRLFFEGKVADFTHSVVVIGDDKGCIKSLAWLLLDLESGVISRTAFTPKLFKVGLVEAAEQIAMFGLGEEVQAALDVDAEPLSRGEIERLISKFANSGRMRFGFSGGNLGLPGSRAG
jgi:hypothetical protein